MNEQQRNKLLYVLSILLLFPALLINLGLMTFIDDEGIRTLVALEMKLSGNYITPTLHGEFYYNKPPLFNWILLGYFKLLGQINEFNTRIPTLVSLLGFAATVFYSFRKQYGTYTAFVLAMTLITCGRILFWDSLLGLIDIIFITSFDDASLISGSMLRGSGRSALVCMSMISDMLSARNGGEPVSMW